MRNAGDFSRYEFTTGKHPAVQFLNELKHTGDFYGVPFELRDWEEAIIRLIYRADMSRRCRTAFLGIPRKNGKTELAAGIALLELFRSKPERRIYSASGDQKQAALVFGAAASMVSQHEHLDAAALVYQGYKQIRYEPMGSTYEAVSSEAFTKHGLRPSVVIFDEFHVLPNRDLYTVFNSAFGGTVDPFMLIISTAGWDRTSVCWEKWKHARAVRDGLEDDPKFLGILFEANEEVDDWRDEAVWHRVNPALGDYCSIEDMRDGFREATDFPIHENEFKRLKLNIWTEQATRWIAAEAWKACGVAQCSWSPSEYEGEPCYAGFDYGVNGDMAALALVFPRDDGTVKVCGRAWAPIDGKWRKEARTGDLYNLWEKEGYLHFTPGSCIDESIVEDHVIEIAQRFPFYLLFADRAYCNKLLIRLYNESLIETKGIPQGAVTLNEACVLLEKLVMDRMIHHLDHPILAWNIANASAERTKTGLMHLDKSSTTERIDFLAALINALAAWIADKEQRGSSVYETPGQLAL